MDLQDRLAEGQTFESWDELRDAIVDFGVATERIIVTYKKDSSRFIGKCKMNVPSSTKSKLSCRMSVRAILKCTTDVITITQSCTHHTCEASDHYERRMHTNSDRLADKIQDIITKNRQTRACHLMHTAQALVHPDIKYHTAHRAKRKATHRLDGKESESFWLIPSHCHHILERDPGATAKWSAPGGHFETLFVCPSASRKALKVCRPWIAFDGTHTRSMYPQILLIATALDPNNQIYFLAYYMVPVENEQHWTRFAELLLDAIPEIGRPGTVFISDRQKGLLATVQSVFPRGYHAFCSWHLGDNVRCKYGRKWEKEFIPLVYAVTPEKFHGILEKIRGKSRDVANYIDTTAGPEHYSRAFIPFRRWGHETSQQAESLNKALKPQRQEVAFRQSNMLWDYMMRMVWEKHQVSLSLDTPFGPKIMAMLKGIEEAAYHLTADVSHEEEVRISDGIHGDYLVNFSPEWRCSCGDWQDHLIPCKHAWQAMTKLKRRHLDYVSPLYSTENFKEMYSFHIPAILSADLTPNKYCGEPLYRRQAGRPSDKQRTRFEEEDPVRHNRRCGFCKARGHDKRKCDAYIAQLSHARGIQDEHNSGCEDESDQTGPTQESMDLFPLQLYTTQGSCTNIL